jgi:hypothetical protein
MRLARTCRVSLTEVLCAIDFSPASFMALPVAATLACHDGGEIFLPRIAPAKTTAPPFPPTSDVASGQELMQACVEQCLNTKLPAVLTVNVAGRCQIFREEEDDTSA